MPVESQRALFLIALGVVILLACKKPQQAKEATVPVPSVEIPEDAIVIVPPIGDAAGLGVDEWAKANNMEIRRYAEDANLDGAEDWVKALFVLSEGHRPAAVVSKNGDVTIIEIDDKLIEKLEALK